MPAQVSPLIVYSNGAYYKLSAEGVLEMISIVERDPAGTRVGLKQNLASSVSNSDAKPQGEQSGLVGVDVHGTRMFKRARL